MSSISSKSNVETHLPSQQGILQSTFEYPSVNVICESSSINVDYPIQGDRFIPVRNSMNLELAHYSLYFEDDREQCNAAIASPLKEDYKRKLSENLFPTLGTPEKSRILSFQNRSNSQTNQASASKPSPANRLKKFRYIPSVSERILDAPELVDDYYLNLLDWSVNNRIAVALGTTVYLWDATSGEIHLLAQTGEVDDYVTSVSWAADGRHLAVGLNSCEVQLWDVTRLRQVRRLQGHRARVGSLAWNGHILSSGSRDSLILNHDVRVRDHVVTKLNSHEQEVCGLKWSRSGSQLASGGNDNLLHIWDSAVTRTVSSSSNSNSPTRGKRYLHRFDGHRAAVKALAWCPFQSNLLASGGGTADRCIRFWNTSTGACTNTIDTHSQVCSLQWSRHEKEILSSHGYSQNQLILWKYPSMAKLAELTGHSARVLHMAQSPDGYTVVSAAADETLRFWKVFGFPQTKQTNKNKHSNATIQSLRAMSIR